MDQDNPIVAFYKKHDITTDHHDLGDLIRHFRRREKLYRTLGLPPTLFDDKIVLEVGPGRGHNALPLFAWGAKLVFVEPNPKAQSGLSDMLSLYGIDPDSWVLHNQRIEDLEVNEPYDVVIAEGFLPGMVERTEVIASIDSHLKPGGVAVVNCADELSYFFEIIKRIIGRRLLQMRGIEALESQIEALTCAFDGHFARLRHATRDISDWILDQFLNPAVYGKPFSLADSVEEFGPQYTLMGSSPSMFSDLSWYKDIDRDRNAELREQFNRKRHVMLHMDLDESVRSPGENDRLVHVVRRFFQRAKAGLINYKAIIKVREHIIVCRLRRRCSVDTGPFARDC